MENWIVASIFAAVALMIAFNNKVNIAVRAVMLFAGAVLAFFAAQAAFNSPTAWIIATIVAASAAAVFIFKYRAKRRKQKEDDRKNGGTSINLFLNR